MRVAVTAAAAAAVLLVVGAAAVVWIGLAFDTVPIRWDPSIGNSCRAVDPGTLADLRRAAAVPLALTTLCSAGLAVLAASGHARRERASVAVPVALVLSTLAGALLLWWAYAIGDVFSVLAAVVVAGLALALVGGALAAARATTGTWEGLGRPFWLAVLQVLVVPAVIMATTFTDEIPIC